MTYFAQIVDAWDCELDFIGPFTSEDAANTAAFDKWDGEDGCRVYIVRRLPASNNWKNIFYRLDTAKADEYNRAKERKGKENDNACADRSRKEIQGIQGYGQW